ncbi:MAG: hypothetical protein QOK36_1491 [Gaiellales bacterium]|jgi:hypothetical protein|nr:hypothetical protein [Gaiellales bacterium]
MARRPVLLALLLPALAAAPGVAGSAGERLHRLRVPPPPASPLPHSLAVDEFEFGVRGSHLEVAAGRLRIHVYNRGMDDHDLTLVDAHGQVQSVPLAAGGDAELDADVASGALRIYCSLFAGTADSHLAKGMLFDITVR